MVYSHSSACVSAWSTLSSACLSAWSTLTRLHMSVHGPLSLVCMCQCMVQSHSSACVSAWSTLSSACVSAWSSLTRLRVLVHGPVSHLHGLRVSMHDLTHLQLSACMCMVNVDSSLICVCIADCVMHAWYM